MIEKIIPFAYAGVNGLILAHTNSIYYPLGIVFIGVPLMAGIVLNWPYRKEIKIEEER